MGRNTQPCGRRSATPPATGPTRSSGADLRIARYGGGSPEPRPAGRAGGRPVRGGSGSSACARWRRTGPRGRGGAVSARRARPGPTRPDAGGAHNFRYEIAVTVTVQWLAWPSRTPSGNAASGSARALPRLRPGLTEVYPTHFQPHPRSLSPRPQARRASQGPSRRPSPSAAAARASRPRRFPPVASLIRSCRSTSRCDDAVARSSRSGSRGGSATATGDVSRPRCGPSRRPFHTTSNSSSSVAILEPGESCGPVEIHPGLEPGRDGQLARVDQPLIGPARHAVAPLLVADTRDARTDRQRLGAAEVSDRAAVGATSPP